MRNRSGSRVVLVCSAIAAVVAASSPRAHSAPAQGSVAHAVTPSTPGKAGGGRILRDVPAGVPNGGLFPVTPTRVADTRPAPDARGTVRRLGANSSADFTMTGVPAGAVAVVLNVTAVSPDAPGHLTLFPAGGVRPTVSSVNFVAGQIVPNLVQVKLGANNAVSVFNGSTGGVDVILDLLAYYEPGGAVFSPLAVRYTDRTMNGGTTFIGTVPATVSNRTVVAYALNLTVDRPSDAGWLAVRPAGPPTGTSNVNFLAGQTRANAAVTGLSDAISSTGQALRNEEYEIAPYVQSARVVVDEMGTFFSSTGSTAGNFVPLEPCRIGDTRPAPDQRGNLTTRVSGAGPVQLQVAGRCGLPANPRDIDSIAVNVTAVNPSNDGYFRLWRSDSPEPQTSAVNFLAGQTVANHAIVETALDGNIGVRLSSGTADLVVDVSGYYAT